MKKLLLIILAFTMLISTVFALASCSKDDSDGNDQVGNNDNAGGNENDNTNSGSYPETTVKYTVKVVDEDGNGVAGAPVELFIGPAKGIKLITDEIGFATYEMEETNLPMYAVLGILPEGYGDGETTEVDFVPGFRSATITVVKQVAYKVSFVDATGNAIEGVLAQVCVGDTCLAGKTTGPDGELVFYLNPDSVLVSLQINQVPEPFAQDLVGTKQYFEDGQFEIVVTLDE